jgi:phosphonate transport system permease protein
MLMVDIALGPEQGKRPSIPDTRTAYLDMVRRKRMYGGILLVLFIGLFASGWMLSEHRNAGGFWNGLPQCCPRHGPTAPTCRAYSCNSCPP